MSGTDYIERLFNTMMQFGKLITQRTHESHEERIATILQLSALNFLKTQPNATVGDLAHSLQLSKSSATQLVERLVRTCLVGRQHDKKDRRIVRLVLTGRGQKHILVLKKQILEKLSKIFSKVPKEDIKKLIRIYTDLIKRLKNEDFE